MLVVSGLTNWIPQARRRLSRCPFLRAGFCPLFFVTPSPPVSLNLMSLSWGPSNKNHLLVGRGSCASRTLSKHEILPVGYPG